MSEATKPAAIEAAAVPPARATRGYPEPFAARVAGRERRALGEVFGLTNFGVNLTLCCRRAACRRCAIRICARTNSSSLSRANPFS
jgi:hypothetical protein